MDLGSRAAFDFYHLLSAHMQKLAPEFGVEFEGSFAFEVFAIDNLDAKHFHAIADLIMQACEQIKSLQMHKDAIWAAIEADRRFLTKAA